MINGSNNGKPCRVQGFLFWCGALLFLAACNTGGPGVKNDLLTLTGKAQGTTFTIKYLDSLQRDLSRPVDSLLKVVDRSLSLWDSSSTVRHFNAVPDTFQSKDPHFRIVLALSQNLWRTTHQAFDPTVLPVVRAWGVGQAGRSDMDTAAVAGMKQLVGMDKTGSNKDPCPTGICTRWSPISVLFRVSSSIRTALRKAIQWT